MLKNLNLKKVESGKWRVESCSSLLAFLIFVTLMLSVSAGAQNTKANLYDIDASGTDIKFVLEALAQRSGSNIVVSPDIVGQITAHLKQLPIESILDQLSVVHGFQWKQKDGTYLVAGKDKFEMPAVAAAIPSEPETLIWKCRHMKASGLVAVISSIFPNFKVAGGPGSVSPELTSSSSSTGSSGGGSSSSSSGSADSSSKGNDNATTIVIYGDPKELVKAKELLEKLDVRRQQVAIEVAITEVNSHFNKEIGIDWSWNDLVLQEGASLGSIKFGNFTKQGMTFSGAVAAMVNDGGAKLLAQPNISVMDGLDANILIGDRILFPKLIGYNQVGAPLYDKAEERVGIYLQIAPRITDDNEIMLTLYPQVSLVTGYLKTQAGDYPQISTREARTTVSVKNGATLAIGGLLQDNEIKQASKIPLLGDLPIIGQFFRHSKTTKERTELVIFLTPKIVKDN